MVRRFGVVDLFAGPGGLAEGFSAFIADGVKPFGICLSVEKEKSAHATLLLRSFLRQFPEQYPQPYYDWLNGTISSEPRWSDLFPDEWRAAEHEALNLTLGEADAKEAIDARLASIREDYGDDTILVGGPPCQAYSLVGRARNRGIDGYDPVQDHRHYLYREYIRILGELRPAAFVMENVKGMLSSSVDGTKIFDRVLADLKAAAGQDSYELFSLSADADLRPVTTAKDPRDYVIRAEEFGVPQARHRVIVVGIRRDL
ncbi:MAG: DNA cytosine methyltransferase, partial [Oxalobacteraceae bacterium]